MTDSATAHDQAVGLVTALLGADTPESAAEMFGPMLSDVRDPMAVIFCLSQIATTALRVAAGSNEAASQNWPDVVAYLHEIWGNGGDIASPPGWNPTARSSQWGRHACPHCQGAVVIEVDCDHGRAGSRESVINCRLRGSA